jgi:hypothetical protein
MHFGNFLRMANHHKRIDAMQLPSPTADRVGVSFLQRAQLHILTSTLYLKCEPFLQGIFYICTS